MAKKKTEPQPYVKADKIQLRGSEVFCPLKEKWLKASPEERVRQDFILHLKHHYGYDFEHMAQEKKHSMADAVPRPISLFIHPPKPKPMEKHP